MDVVAERLTQRLQSGYEASLSRMTKQHEQHIHETKTAANLVMEETVDKYEELLLQQEQCRKTDIQVLTSKVSELTSHIQELELQCSVQRDTNLQDKQHYQEYQVEIEVCDTNLVHVRLWFIDSMHVIFRNRTNKN